MPWGTNRASNNQYRLVYRRMGANGRPEYGKPSGVLELSDNNRGGPEIYFEFEMSVDVSDVRFGSPVLVLQRRDMIRRESDFSDAYTFPDPNIKPYVPTPGDPLEPLAGINFKIVPAGSS
jgi:hypothetical protein